MSNEFRRTQRWHNGVSARIDRLPGWDFFLAHFVRECGPHAGQRALRFNAARAGFERTAGHTLLASGYFHDQERALAATGFTDSSYRILTMRADGRVPVNTEYAIVYTFEHGVQRPYRDGDERIRATYALTTVGAQWNGLRLSADQERLGSNAGIYGMQNPLGPLHPNQGWADKFNVTPVHGVRDRWLSGDYPFGAFSWFAEAHRFKSDMGGIDYGR